MKEYWIVDPYNLSVEIYTLEEASFKQTAVYGKDDLLTVSILSDLQIDLKNIFKE